VPASGFYEWQRKPRGKQPYWISLKDEPLFALAGLWDVWEDPESGDALHSYTILTCGPNALMEPIHHRMPVILDRDAEELWLDPDVVEVERLQAVLRPFPARQMQAWPVSTAVNSPHRDSAELTAPLDAERR
jgi:putative SOS response-associated peptidase YedK